jgi:uncharacterized protein YgbK (DUF1537 family)
MIVVLADDLSGAAELAGVAVRRGLAAEVQTVFHPATAADVVCLDTNSRLLPDAAAATRVAGFARQVAQTRPDWVFKKCDSVLRGPVLAEARATARETGQSQIMLLPANPSRERLVRGGCYFVEGVPLHETFFARDPLHPRTTSCIRELLGGDLAGVTLPDAHSVADVHAQAESIDRGTLPVGAADFFDALLEVRLPRRELVAPVLPGAGPMVLVCGSTASWSQRQREAGTVGVPHFALPHDVGAVLRTFNASGRVLLGIGEGPENHRLAPTVLTARLAETTATLVREATVARVMIEGGATAAAILQALGWTRLSALHTIGDVAVMHRAGALGPTLLIKPGSYAWPPMLWPGN